VPAASIAARAAAAVAAGVTTLARVATRRLSSISSMDASVDAGGGAEAREPLDPCPSRGVPGFEGSLEEMEESFEAREPSSARGVLGFEGCLEVAFEGCWEARGVVPALMDASTLATSDSSRGDFHGMEAVNMAASWICLRTSLLTAECTSRCDCPLYRHADWLDANRPVSIESAWSTKASAFEASWRLLSAGSMKGGKASAALRGGEAELFAADNLPRSVSASCCPSWVSPDRGKEPTV
jgi:hypothetical protein